MNVIMVCESATVSGGAEKVAIQEAIELRQRGFRVGFISAGNEAAPELLEAGVEVLLLDTKSFFEETRRNVKIQKLFFNAEIERAVQKFLIGFEPSETIVHLHTFRLKLSGGVAHTAQTLGFKTFVHCHDYTPVCPTSLLYDHRQGANCERRPMSFSCMTCECQNQAWKYKLPKLTSFFWNQSVWKINRRAHGLIHISQLEKATINDRTGKALPAYYVPPISSLKAEERVAAENNSNYLFIGRLTPEKGIRAFLDATTSLGLSAVVIGDGPLMNELREAFPSARFTGWIDQNEIANEMRLARALVVPSVWRETLCLSVIDALQQGVPSLVSDQVGAKEFVRDGENGFVFTSGGLTDALNRCSDNALVANLSQAAWQTFLDRPPTVEAHVNALVEVYQGALGASRS